MKCEAASPHLHCCRLNRTLQESLASANAPMLRAALLLLLLWFTVVAPASADNEIDTVTLYFENDMFAVYERSDRWYTHGSKLIWTYKETQPDGPFGLLAAIPRLLLQRGTDVTGGPLTIAGQAGLNIYTPQELYKTNFEPRDRPYSGWLYVGAIAQRPIGRWLETTELKLGLVGAASLAKQFQDLTHFILDGRRAGGWDYQQSGRVGVELGYLGRYMLAPLTEWLALTPHIGVTSGNVRNMARAGFSVVFGGQVAGAAVPGSGEGIGDTLTPISDPVAVRGSLWSGLYGFVSFDSSLVASNLLITGQTHGGTPTLTLRHRVQQAVVGVALVLPQTWFGPSGRIGYAHFNRSQEFESPGFTPYPRQHFGTFWLTLKF
jgi:lipid A 3-O-deacylase